jgi:hypothetical protein
VFPPQCSQDGGDSTHIRFPDNILPHQATPDKQMMYTLDSPGRRNTLKSCGRFFI